VYFSDPEGNGVEVFIDTPWHVAQPQGRALDLDRTNDEIEDWTRQEFGAEPEFGSIEEFYERRARHLSDRRA
jgi:catechol 2,3-dioxygenase